MEPAIFLLEDVSAGAGDSVSGTFVRPDAARNTIELGLADQAAGYQLVWVGVRPPTYDFPGQRGRNTRQCAQLGTRCGVEVQLRATLPRAGRSSVLPALLDPGNNVSRFPSSLARCLPGLDAGVLRIVTDLPGVFGSLAANPLVCCLMGAGTGRREAEEQDPAQRDGPAYGLGAT